MKWFDRFKKKTPLDEAVDQLVRLQKEDARIKLGGTKYIPPTCHHDWSRPAQAVGIDTDGRQTAVSTTMCRKCGIFKSDWEMWLREAEVAREYKRHEAELVDGLLTWLRTNGNGHVIMKSTTKDDGLYDIAGQWKLYDLIEFVKRRL